MTHFMDSHAIDGAIDRLDPATGIEVFVVTGQGTWGFLPGDAGPFGVVDGPARYHIIGTVTQTWDTNTNPSAGAMNL